MKPERIVLHCSATKDTETASWPVIRGIHKNQGWSDIGYHFGIENLRGQTEVLMGRMPNKQGAHVRGHNTGSLGICFMGNFDLYPVPWEMWSRGVELCQYLVQAFGITEILGHRELDSGKTCPGRNFNLNKFRREVFL